MSDLLHWFIHAALADVVYFICVSVLVGAAVFAMASFDRDFWARWAGKRKR